MKPAAGRVLATAALLSTVPWAGLGCHRESTAERAPAAAASPAEPAKALVRLVAAIPESRPLDVYAGDAAAFAAVPYRAVTAYAELGSGTTVFRLRPAGQDRADPLAENREGLARGGRYTLVALPGSSGHPAELKVLRDELGPGHAASARVRVVNACPDAGAVAVFVGARTEALVSGVGANEASGYHDVAPISGTLELRRESHEQVLARLPDTRLESGGLYTVLLLGRLAGGLEAMLVEDQRVAMP